ncbi:MAG: aspartate/methionine/tyrosine aminotransferase [Planctomycetota bacterium]|jgi:aspartate/methionine/tyrosine aminotransferase
MTQTLQFPYMFWAHHEGFQSPWCLSQSGMPLPEASFMDGIGIDFSHPCVEAMPAVEARLGELFGVPSERVLVTIGGSSAMQISAMQWFRPGARVLAETPSYEPMRKLPEFYGADVRPLQRRAADDWMVNPEEVRDGLAGTTGRGHVFLTNMHNPTGALMDAERMTAIAAEAAKTGGVLVSNEAYMEFLPTERRVHAFALAPNAVSLGTLTKAYGMGGLRIGWMILGEGIADEFMNVMDMSYLAYVDPPTPSLVGALRALDNLELLSQPIRKVEVESRPHWERWLRETPGIRSHIPEFGLIAFPRVEGVDDTAGLVSYLQAEHQVDVVPGEYFGLRGHVRVGCGVPPETLKDGLERLTIGIEAWRALGK